MDKVRVYIVAGPNQGKTTIAHIIKDALVSHEFKAVSLQDLKTSGEAKEPIEQRVQATKERPVSIEVVSVVPNQTSANAIPSIVAREWLRVLKNLRTNLPPDQPELDNVIEELQALTR